jgi:hypothetical protein
MERVNAHSPGVITVTRSVLLVLLLLLLVPLAGCGKKGPLRPLLKPLPAAPGAFNIRQDGERLLLSWTLPKTNLDGTPLTDLQGFHIYRIEFDLGHDCPECRDPDEPRGDLDLDFLRGAVRQGERIFFWDDAVRHGKGYRYRVKAVTKAGREGDGSVAARVVQLAAPAPGALQASGRDRQVRLRWEAPAAAPLEGSLAGYNLYRAEGDAPLPPLPLNSALITATSYDDFGLINGTSYRYVVRSVVSIGADLVESAASEPVVAIPQPEP